MAKLGEANINEAAIILGYSVVTLKKWINEGLPVKSKGGRGKSYVLSIPDCVKWIADRRVQDEIGDVSKVSEKELRNRQLRANTTLAEIDAAKKRGEVVYVEDVVRIRTAEAIAVKNKLLSIPGRIDHVLAGSSDRKFCNRTLLDEIYGALDELANRSIEFDEIFNSEIESGGAESLGSSVQDQAVRVGRGKRKSTGRKRTTRKP